MTAITVLEKKSSASRTLNDVCSFVLQMAWIYDFPITNAVWIPTASNEADGLSRLGYVTDTWKAQT